LVPAWCTIVGSNVSDQTLDGAATVSREQRRHLPRRWTLHGLNNGVIFSATCRGVAVLPRSLSYAIGHTGTWLAWRLMHETRAAIADNLRVLFPGAGARELERRALDTLRAYARDMIDFLRALEATDEQVRAMFQFQERDTRVFREVLGGNRGMILVTGHFGNWEIGSVFVRRVLQLPLTIVAMSEASENVNRMRREIRDRLETGTIEVRKSLDTALKIRRQLSENHMVAMLMDRHLGDDRVEVSLLGRRAWFLRTPAMMGYLTGAPLVPCFIERLGRARFNVHAGEPIVVSREVPRDEAITQAAQQFADQLAARIAIRPQNWYHFYPYWQAQSEGYGGWGA
jgi:KDO2-lipid IV(A) lauroyltransferase